LTSRLDGTSGLKEDATRTLLVLDLGLGAPVDVADDVVDRLLHLGTRRELVEGKVDALLVLARDVHGRQGRATGTRSRGVGSIVGWRAAIDAVGGDRGRLLAPGGCDRSLSARLDGTKGWEGLLRRSVQSRLLGRGRSILGLLLAGRLVAEGSRGISRGSRVSELVLVGNVLHSDVVVVLLLLHEPLRRGEAIRGRAGDDFGCHG
jgi:hypothetical protein